MLLHLKFKLLQRVFKISFDDGTNGFDVFVVVFGANFIYTRCRQLPNWYSRQTLYLSAAIFSKGHSYKCAMGKGL